MRQSAKGRSGQSVIEFILMVVVALTVLGVISGAFFKMRSRIYFKIVCEVSAACPGCPAPEEVRGIANRASPGSCP